MTGASNSGYAVRAYNASASGWSVYADGASQNYFAGNVGIGNDATPSDKLVIEYADADNGMYIQNDSSTTARYPALGIYDYTGGLGGGPALYLGAGRGTSSTPAAVLSNDVLGWVVGLGQYDTTANHLGEGAQIAFLASGNFSSTSYPTDIAFYTVASGSTSDTERMRITASGKVGIGTTNPSMTLDIVQDTTTDLVKLKNTNAAKYTEPGFYDSSDVQQGWAGWGNASAGTPNNLYFGTQNGYPVSFWTNGTERIRIDSSGNVGIGRTAPNTTLDVNGFIEWSGQSRVTSTFSKTSNTTLAAITGLSATLTAGKTYYFDLILYTTSGGSGGTNADLNGGTATATALIGDAILFDSGTAHQTRFSALNTALCNQLNVTAANCHITGTITVNAGGTFIPRFAQLNSNATASTVAVGSIMIVNQIN